MNGFLNLFLRGRIYTIMFTFTFLLAIALLGSQASDLAPAGQEIAQWVPSNQGIVGANVIGVAIDPQTPTTLYALTNHDGVYKSTDEGLTWTEKNQGLPAVQLVKWGHLYADLLTMDPNNPNTLYVPIQGRVYKSTDGAESWFESSQGTSFPRCGSNGDNIAGILIDPEDPHHLFSGTIASGCDGGLFESMDGGRSWTQIAGSNLRGSRLGNDAWAITFDRTRPRRMYLGTAKDAFLFSFVGGSQWQRLTPSQAVGFSRVVAVDPLAPNRVFLGNGNGLFIFPFTALGLLRAPSHLFSGNDIWSIRFSPSDPQVVYVAANEGGIYKSTDGGRQWQHLGQADGFPQSLAIHPLNPDIVYIGSSGVGVHRSGDGGRHFLARGEGLPFSAGVKTLRRDPQDESVFYAGVSDSGLYKSLDRGRSWMKLSSDMNVVNAFHLTIDPMNPNIFYGGDQVIKKSTDGGRTWAEVLKPEKAFFRSLALDPNHPATLFTVDATTLSMYKSTDGGRTWSIKPSYAPMSSVRVAESIVVDPNDSSRVYAASYDFLWKSADGGETWHRVMNGLQQIPMAFLVDMVTVDPVSPNIVYLTTPLSGIFKSTDFGETWSRTGFFNSFPGRLIVDAADHTRLYVATLDGWFRSIDGGRSWVPQSRAGLPAGDFFQAKFAGLIQDALNPDRFYIGSGLSGILIFDSNR